MWLNGSVEKTTWMKCLHDTLLMCKISIPGTHDSGTTKGGDMLKTQSETIPVQLQLGIRAFDIRLEKKNNKLGIFHSYAFQDLYWEDDVLPAFISFLQAYPSETLIVSLKKEGGELQDYASLVSASLSNSVYQDYFVTDFHPELTLKDCRGKILFLHRDSAMINYPGAACVGWEDNKTCLLILCNKDGKESRVLLQDEYQYESGKDAGKKIITIIRNIDVVSDQPASSRKWGISFVSATGLPLGTPKIFADQINQPVADYLEQEHKRNCGIVFIDFINDKGGKELVEYLIESNIK
jgi:1-phosphatidylinositol phosphodiesterase